MLDGLNTAPTSGGHLAPIYPIVATWPPCVGAIRWQGIWRPYGVELLVTIWPPDRLAEVWFQHYGGHMATIG